MWKKVSSSLPPCGSWTPLSSGLTAVPVSAFFFFFWFPDRETNPVSAEASLRLLVLESGSCSPELILLSLYPEGWDCREQQNHLVLRQVLLKVRQA